MQRRETSVGTTRGRAGGPVSSSGNLAKDAKEGPAGWILGVVKVEIAPPKVGPESMILRVCLFACLPVLEHGTGSKACQNRVGFSFVHRDDEVAQICGAGIHLLRNVNHRTN